MKNCNHRPLMINIDRSINHAGDAGMICKYCGAPLKCVNTGRLFPAVLPLILFLIIVFFTKLELRLGLLIHANDPAGAGFVLLLFAALALSAGIAALIWRRLEFVDRRTLPKDPLYQREPDPEVYNKYEL